MKITELSCREFADIYHPSHIFNSVDFAELNREKAESIRYLSFDDSHHRLGIILGERDGILRSPFSAPFGGFTTNSPVGLIRMEEAVDLLCAYAEDLNMQLAVTLQPLVYDETQLSKWVNVMMRKLKVSHVDLNYHIDLSSGSDYERIIDRSARNHLHQAQKKNLILKCLDNTRFQDVARVYDVIQRNHKERGFPLRMTLEQVWQTVSKVVKADFFVLEHEGADVAAAQVFHVADDAVQIVYWGDIREYSALRPMNFLAFSLYCFYHAKGLRILDIGPSTENGFPNYGLCEFKENIGCSTSLKFSFTNDKIS